MCIRDRGVAHQIDAIGIGASALPYAARIDDGHEHQSYGFQLSMQHAVPLQAHHQAAQIGDHNFGADSFAALHAAKKADGGNVRTLSLIHI